MSRYQFCTDCGSILERGKICRNCSKFLSKREKLAEKKAPQRFLVKHSSDEQDRPLPKKISETTFVRARRPRTVARYSEDGGLEIGWDLETPERRAVRAVWCVRCKNLRANWEGIWIIPGGRGRSLDPMVRPKRVFLCGSCWSPYKSRQRVEIEELGLTEEQLFNPGQ